MSVLQHEQCEACRADAPVLTHVQIDELIQQLPEWVCLEVEGVKRLQRIYPFKNFIDALAFTNKVAALAEEHGHHPALLTEWGRVTVSWWTHKIRGLHRNDFIMAAKSDELL